MVLCPTTDVNRCVSHHCDEWWLTSLLPLAFTSYCAFSRSLRLVPTLPTERWFNLTFHEQKVKCLWLSEVFLWFLPESNIPLYGCAERRILQNGELGEIEHRPLSQLVSRTCGATRPNNAQRQTFEWLNWRGFSILPFNLLFQFCKWDGYWLSQRSCGEQRSLFPEPSLPSSCLQQLGKRLSVLQQQTLKMLCKDYYVAAGCVSHSGVYCSAALP